MNFPRTAKGCDPNQGVTAIASRVDKSHPARVASSVDHTVAMNIRGTFAAIQGAVARPASGSRIITIGSSHADRAHPPGTPLYAMTKAAVAGSTGALGPRAGTTRHQRNVIQSGPVVTDTNPRTGEFAETIRALLTPYRYGHREDVANAVAYLADPRNGT